MMDSSVIQDIQTCPMVKNIPTGISHLLGIITNDDLDIDDLINHILKFPVICTRIVMVANSAWAAPKTEIVDLKRACLQLGLKMVKSITIALLVSQQFNTQKCKGFDEKNYWLSSLIIADLMLQMEKGEKVSASSSSAHLIGLIHNIGLLVIAELYPDKFSQALLISNNSEQTFSQSLKNVVGIGYLEASSLVLTSWDLPSQIANTYDKNLSDTDNKELFFKALTLKNYLDVNIQPYKIINEDQIADEEKVFLEQVTEQSEVIEKLCTLYCQ